MRSVYSLLACVALAVSAAVLPAADAFRVVGGSAAVMTSPSENGDPVYTVAVGDRLVPTGKTAGEWVQVRIPSECKLYVYAKLAAEGIVQATRLRVRTGPGIAFPSVGEVAKGGVLIVLGDEGDWLAVAAPDGCAGWVRSQHRGGLAPAPSPVATTMTVPVAAVVSPPSEEPPPERTPTAPPRPVNATPDVVEVRPPEPRVRPVPVAAPVTSPVQAAPTSHSLASAAPEPRASSAVVHRPEATPTGESAHQPAGQSVAPRRVIVDGEIAQLGLRDDPTVAKPPVMASAPMSEARAPYQGAEGRVRIQGFLQKSGSWHPWGKARHRIVSRGAGYPETVCWVDGSVPAWLVGKPVEASGRLVYRQGTRTPYLVAEVLRGRQE